ncbi:hypothetical protein, partial [Tropicimonas marinistellae]|uniref:hypothetical protein n=1 Tax=Tropicimonas marinistellae TaxID=1739787 RepID=UPI001F3CADB4
HRCPADRRRAAPAGWFRIVNATRYLPNGWLADAARSKGRQTVAHRRPTDRRDAARAGVGYD